MTTEIQKTDERGGWTSASNAAADRLCEGRHQAHKGLPDVDSADAEFGRKIHDAMAKASPEGLTDKQQAIYEQCNEITDKLMDQFFGPDKVKATIVREKRLWCKVNKVSGVPDVALPHSGMPDFVARIGSRCLIIEYKMLPGDVPEAPSNEQLRDQVVLIAGNYGLRSECSIGAAVVQPLVTHSPEICLYNSESVLRAEQEMFNRVRKSNTPNAPRTANSVSCKFCLAKFQCREYAQWSESLLPAPTKVVGMPVSEWTPDMRAYYCEMRGTAKRWLEECDAEMKRLLTSDPNAIPGWKLEDGNVIQTVTEPEVLFGRFAKLAKDFATEQAPADPDKLITELFVGCVKVGKENFESLVRKVTGLKGKALKAKIEELLDGVTKDKQNAPSLAKKTVAEMAAPPPPAAPVEEPPIVEVS